jgi:hypothetical protein
MELLQFTYFNRNKGGVISLDVGWNVRSYKKTLRFPKEQNDWFKKSEFVDLRKGDAMDLPVDDNSIDIYIKLLV